VANSFIQFEKELALKDFNDPVQEIGEVLTFELNNESNVSRDRLNSIQQTNKASPLILEIKAFPINMSPTRRELIESGIKKEVDILIHTANQEWKDKGIEFENIDIIRTRVRFRKGQYQIKEKALVSQFSDEFLYITFGLLKR